MQSFRSLALWVTLLAPTAFFAQTVTTEGTVGVAVGGALLDGDRPAFQQVYQRQKDGYIGIEEFRLVSEGKDSTFRFGARFIPDNDDYRLLARFERTDRFYVEAGYNQFRIWSDGSGGYFRPSGTEFTMFNEELSLMRDKLWVEAGAYMADKTLMKLRFERQSRDGTKSSTYWGDTNLVGAPYGTRNIVPTFYDLYEVTNLFTFDVGNDEAENSKWHLGARYSETTRDDKRYSRRRPFETADRIVTSKDETKTDIFALNGFYQRKVSEQLTLSAGGLITKLDTVIEGSRIYGQTYDPAFDPAYVRRQQRDEGFYALEGAAELKQTVLNVNAVYVPKKNWSVRGSVRFENLHQETMAEFIETNIGAGPAFAAIIEPVEGEHKKAWDEFAEAIEVRYTGTPDWTFAAKGEWIQGTGNLDEKRVIHHATISIDRDTDTERTSQKYTFNANWYAKPGLTFAAQYYFKGNMNDYDALRDNTPAGTADRYPAFITDQDFEMHDFNVRMTWRPVSLLNLVTRYDRQQSKIISIEAGLGKGTSSDLKSHIISQSATWSPINQLYLTGNVNVTYDQMKTPAFAFVKNGDNNYVSGSLGGGYAMGKLDDLYVDYSWFRASNFIDNSALSLPYGADQKLQAAYVTWVRRQSAHLVYTVKYGYVTNRDGMWAGRNDFDAHVIYGKVQYHF